MCCPAVYRRTASTQCPPWCCTLAARRTRPGRPRRPRKCTSLPGWSTAGRRRPLHCHLHTQSCTPPPRTRDTTGRCQIQPRGRTRPRRQRGTGSGWTRTDPCTLSSRVRSCTARTARRPPVPRPCSSRGWCRLQCRCQTTRCTARRCAVQSSAAQEGPRLARRCWSTPSGLALQAGTTRQRTSSTRRWRRRTARRSLAA